VSSTSLTFLSTLPSGVGAPCGYRRTESPGDEHAGCRAIEKEHAVIGWTFKRKSFTAVNAVAGHTDAEYMLFPGTATLVSVG
jgi:hypothetical protein